MLELVCWPALWWSSTPGTLENIVERSATIYVQLGGAAYHRFPATLEKPEVFKHPNRTPGWRFYWAFRAPFLPDNNAGWADVPWCTGGTVPSVERTLWQLTTPRDMGLLSDASVGVGAARLHAMDKGEKTRPSRTSDIGHHRNQSTSTMAPWDLISIECVWTDARRDDTERWLHLGGGEVVCWLCLGWPPYSGASAETSQQLARAAG